MNPYESPEIPSATDAARQRKLLVRAVGWIVVGSLIVVASLFISATIMVYRTHGHHREYRTMPVRKFAPRQPPTNGVSLTKLIVD